jgi:hypothetical protein
MYLEFDAQYLQSRQEDAVRSRRAARRDVRPGGNVPPRTSHGKSGPHAITRYETRTPRVAFAIAAVAMTAITLGVSVILPAKLELASHEARIVDAARTVPPAAATSPRS